MEKEVQADLNTLKEMVKEKAEPVPKQVAHMPGAFEADLPESIPKGKTLLVRVRVNLKSDERLTLHYINMDQTEGMFHETFFEKKNGIYEAVVPAEYITGKFDLMVYLSRRSEAEGCRIFPGIYHERFPYPYHIIEVNGGQG